MTTLNLRPANPENAETAAIAAAAAQFLTDLTERFGSVEAGVAAFMAWAADTKEA